MKIQYTLFCKSGKYKPMSTVIEIDSMQEYEENKSKYNKQAILKILHQRKMNYYNLKQYEYTQYKIREYKTKEEREEEKDNKQNNKLLKNLFKTIIKRKKKNKNGIIRNKERFIIKVIQCRLYHRK